MSVGERKSRMIVVDGTGRHAQDLLDAHVWLIKKEEIFFFFCGALGLLR